ncbi:transcriptional regulator [Bacillus cereus m1293]|nr:transcriptional regulator [Bacillus cereus m1293]
MTLATGTYDPGGNVIRDKEKKFDSVKEINQVLHLVLQVIVRR